jgi:hypothetical protein
MTSVKVTEESASAVMPVCVAVNGPIVIAGSGIVRANPEAASAAVIVWLKEIVPVDIVAGVAPATSTLVCADPVSSGSIAKAAPASAAGSWTDV